MKTSNGFKALAAASALLLAGNAQAAVVKAAVAANFTAAMKEIAANYQKASGDKVLLSFGSTGKLYAQIKNGAPFDLFLAADQRRPKLLVASGDADGRFTYAVGKLVLWSAKPGLVDGKGEVLKHGAFAKLAIANPKTAPYGAAAMEVIDHLGLAAVLTPKLVRGDSIAQTQQFVATENAELGFVAKAQVVLQPGGSRWEVPQSLYSPIRQDAVLLKRGEGNGAAKAFLAYLKGPAAKAVIEKYGYGVE